MKLTRRSFSGLNLGAAAFAALAPSLRALAAGARHPFVGKPWPGWKPGEFQIHFIYTGVAESAFYIFPDGTTLLLDCGDHPALTRLELAVPVKPNPGRLAGDWIARYVQRVNPNGADVDYMELSHLHSDHAGCPSWQSCRREGRDRKHDYYRSGFALAAETLRFKKAIDRGWPDYDDPLRTLAAGSEQVLDHMRKLYAWLGARDGLTVEKIRLGARDQLVPLRHPADAKGFEVFNLCANGRYVRKDGSVCDLYAEHIARARPASLNENGMSIGHIFTYGKFKFYTAGDFSDILRTPEGRMMTEDALAEALPKVNVAKVNHHAHYAMPSKLVAALAPQVWTVCVWDQLHCIAGDMARMADRTTYPGERIICPGIFPRERRDEDAGKPWLAAIHPSAFQGGHVVVNVAPGGDAYTVSYLTAEDESMTVRSVLEFKS